jgi:hypothetical protein
VPRKEWCDKNPDRVKELNRKHRAAYRRAHPDRVRAVDAKRRQEDRENRPFVVIDFEGVNTDNGHQLVLIGAHPGNNEVEDWDFLYLDSEKTGEGFSTEFILEQLLLRLKLDVPNGIFISYGFKYDIAMMFRDLTQYQWKAIKLGETRTVMNGRYRVTMRDYRISIKFLKEKGKPCITIYDVMDFFGGTMVDAVETYLSDLFDEEQRRQFEKVCSGKERRGEFTLDDIEEIEEYWIAENYFLPWLVREVQGSIYRELGIYLVEWDSPTQITSKVLEKYEVKKYMAPVPDWVPVDKAFFGGRIESFYAGHVGSEEPLWDYDIGGAYGYGLKFLPDLTDGEWALVDGEGFDWYNDYVPFGIYEVEYECWDSSSSLPQPLPERRGDSVVYPTSTHTWVWGPEAFMVRKEIKLIRAWIYKSPSQCPLGRIADELWNARIRLRRQGDPAEKVIKQGLARMFGKFCQNQGTEIDPLSGEVIKYPPYRNLAYAGFLTSLTRARVYEAVRQSLILGGRVYNISTDGFTTSADIGNWLDGRHGYGNELGEWKAKRYNDMVLVETNMYMVQDRSGDWVIKKAGYGVGYKVSFKEVMRQMARADVWETPLMFPGIVFEDESLEWVTVTRERMLGGKGKRLHTRNCIACSNGLSPCDAPHTLTLRW